jgi:molybdate transport system substrate-binding protein
MRGKRLIVFVAFLGALIVGACSSGRRTVSGRKSALAKNIVVSAAVSLSNAFTEIAHRYRAQTGVEVDFSFGASGELERQIEAGAPVDVFASAGEKEMDDLAAQGLIDKGSRTDFARNALVLVVPWDSQLGLGSFSSLNEPKVRRIAIGNPQTVPAGHYAQQLLTNLHLWPALRPRLIFAEDVRQALDYVMRDEVDAGIVYSTDVAIANGKVRVAGRAPEGLYGPVLYPIAVVKGSSHAEAARQFVDWVRSGESERILERYGFLSVR